VDYSRKVRAAAVQISPVLFSRDGTTEKVLQAIANAAKEGAQIVIFPETFVPYYPYFSFVQPPVMMGKEHMRLYDEAVVVPSPVTDAVGQAARSHGIVVVLGVNERDGGSLYNGMGTGRWCRFEGSRYCGWESGRSCLLGTLQSFGEICVDVSA